jgi:hypothetical protein
MPMSRRAACKGGEISTADQHASGIGRAQHRDATGALARARPAYDAEHLALFDGEANILESRIAMRPEETLA